MLSRSVRTVRTGRSSRSRWLRFFPRLALAPAALAFTFALALALVSLGACSSESPSASEDAGGIDLGELPFVDAEATDSSKLLVDGGYVGPDGDVLREDRFVTKVVSFTPGDCAGFGSTLMPGVVTGPPSGRGDLSGSLDVVSLGIGGEIVVSFEPNAIVDGPGDDFIVFENAFYAAGDPNQPAADPGEISVSEDGETWTTFACTPGPTPPFGACAGWHPVFSAPGNGISPLDPARAGGEAYDLATVGLASARFVRVRDKATRSCSVQPKPTNGGFDLDAVAILHAADP